MTVQRCISVTPDDIVAFNLECKKCHATTKILSNDLRGLPHACRHCGDKWVLGERTDAHSEFFSALGQLTNALSVIRNDTGLVECLFSFELRSSDEIERDLA